MEVVEISREERDVYLIPQNFVDTGTILGGTVKLRNAVEAAVLAVGSAVPLFYLPLAFNIRLMIVIAVSVPLAVFGVVGFGGDSLTQFVAHWFRFMKRRRIVTPTQQGNLEANRHRHLRLISKRYRVVYYDDSDTLPHNAQVLQRKADRHGKLVKRQTLYDLLPIEKIENGILHTTDERHIKILEIEPINFLLRSPREQRSVIYSFASLLKVSPVRLQFKSFSRKADVNAYLDKLRRDAANEPDAAVRKRHIYSISGELLAAADTLLGTATTDENGLAYFDVDVPLRGEHYGSSDAHDWTTNSGRYYLREISVPDGYLIEQSVIPVEFTYENQFIAWQIVDCLHSDKQTTVEIDKRAFASDSDTTFALPGATLTVTDWNGNVVDSWESSDTARVIRGLHLSHDFAGNRDTTKIYTLSETRPADGYTTARSIQFRLEQATGDNSYLQETAVWVLHESEDAEYQSGSIISPTAFSDDSVATIPAKLRAFWDKLLGKNPDADGVVIANWYCVNGMLVVNFTDAANDRAIAKCLRESDFSDLTFDKVYLTGAAAPAFFADKQVADKPTDAEITYSASWILLKDSDGFSQTVTMLDAPTRVKISKADITTHEEIPGATLRVLDKNGNVVDEWVSENTPHYIEAVLVAGETYTLEETLVPDNSGYVPANAVQFTVEDDGEVQHVFMQDDYTKVQISKTDIATGKEISGAKLKITDADGKIVAEWVTDGAPHYMERIPMGTYTLTETMAPTEQGYVRAESVTFEVGPTGDIQRVDALVVFIWQDGGWQKSSEGYLAMYDERTDTPVPLMKTFPQTGSIL